MLRRRVGRPMTWSAAITPLVSGTVIHMVVVDSRCIWVTNILFTRDALMPTSFGGWRENCRRVPSAQSITV